MIFNLFCYGKDVPWLFFVDDVVFLKNKRWKKNKKYRVYLYDQIIFIKDLPFRYSHVHLFTINFKMEDHLPVVEDQDTDVIC